MSRYRVEWQMSGEFVIDTEDSDWTSTDVNFQVDQTLMGSADDVAQKAADEFDECEIIGDSSYHEVKIAKLSEAAEL